MKRFLAASLLFLPACFGLALMESRVRDRASYDLHCASDDVSVQRLGSTTFRATACGRSAIYVCANADVCVLNGRDEPPAPAAAPTTTVANAKPTGPVKVTDRGVVFELGPGFERDDEAKFEVYRDSGRHHAVRLTVESSADTPEAYLTTSHPSAKVWSTEVNGQPMSFARWSGTSLKFTSAVLARAGKLYQLTCSSDDVSSEKTDAVCASVLKSLRFAPAGLPGEE